MTIPGYDSNLSTTGLVVMLYRAMAAYAKDNAFPQTIGTWEASYTHATNNCDKNAPEVKAARDAAWAKAGVTESSTNPSAQTVPLARITTAHGKESTSSRFPRTPRTTGSSRAASGIPSTSLTRR